MAQSSGLTISKSRDDICQLSGNISGRFDNLDQQTQQIISALVAQLGASSGGFSKEIRDQTMALTQLLSRIEDTNMSEHRKTRAMVKERVRKREERILEEYREFKKEKAEKEEKSQADGSKVTSKKKVPILKFSYGPQQDDAREDFFLDAPAEGSMEVDTEITATPEVIDITQEEEHRVRSLVHARILESLKYSTMMTRYEDVAEAYPKTFDWLFDDCATPALISPQSTSERPWSSFVDWLVSGSGVYWVNGKAASGKSTLMRYIYDNPRTREHLNKWTTKAPLCLATFFFWNSGSSEQKSQSGLLRALLYQVLEHHPELSPLVFPSLWARTYSRIVRCLDTVEETWSLSKLTRAFDIMINQKAIELNICFLIDGLDEFEANQNNHKEMDYEEICGLFKNIASLKNVKVCLSSRPWVVFEDSFHNLPSLKLQDLTRGDIEHYISSKFQNSNAFGRLARENPKAAKKLISDVVDKSDGVFLWVRVVVQSLLTGLMNHDGLLDLENRVNILPRDLEALYEHMLKLTDPIYLKWASEIFQIYRTCQHHRDSIGPEDIVEPLTILALFLAVNGDRLGLKGVMSLQEDDVLFECKETGMQMTARCAGLLEISKRKLGSIWLDLTDPIRYMHRTARDFIERDDIWKQLLSYTDETNFNPYESLMKSCILQLSLAPTELFEANKNTESRRKHIRWVERTATSAMIYAHFTDLQTNKADAEWLDRLDKIMTRFYHLHKLDNKHWSNQDFLRLHLLGGLSQGTSMRELPFQGFISYAVQFGLTTYVDEKLRQQGLRINANDEVPLLQYAVRCPPAVLRYPHSNKMASLLLRSGEDPNENISRLYSLGRSTEIHPRRFYPDEHEGWGLSCRTAARVPENYWNFNRGRCESQGVYQR